MTIPGILENIVADIIVAATIGVSAAILLLATRWRSYARLLRFFGCRGEHPELVVFFSRLLVQPGGASDFEGTHRSYGQPAIPESEYLLSRSIAEALERPASSWLSGTLVSAIRRIPLQSLRQWLEPQRVAVRYELSPGSSPAPLPNAATICLGSPGYNYATHFYLSNLSPLLTFGPVLRPGPGTRSDIRLPGGPPVGHSGDIGMLQRLRSGGGHAVFIAAGLGTNGTRGALEYLFANWGDLKKRFGESDDFALALGFPWVELDPLGFERPTELLQRRR